MLTLLPDQPPETPELDYRAFLEAKRPVAATDGFTVDPAEVNLLLKPHQRDIVVWACRGGRRAIFAAFGLGKTVIQIEIVRLVLKHLGRGRGLIVLPLGVRQEFMRDAAKLGQAVTFIRSTDEASADGIYLTNYESVREGKIDVALFVVVSLDEAAILRSFGGTKTFREFMRLFAAVRYRFVATATPSPNEYVELLAYAGFLDVMDIGQAKTRFFRRNSEKADELTIHEHKTKEFWLWMSSWATFLQKPSDLCRCECRRSWICEESASDDLSPRLGISMPSAEAPGSAAAIAAERTSQDPTTSEAGGSSAADVSAQSTAEREPGSTGFGAASSIDAPMLGTRTGPTMVAEASSSASVGAVSQTSAPTWESPRQALPSSASTTMATTSPATVDGPRGRPKRATPGEPSSSVIEDEPSRSPHGLRSSASATGSSTHAASSAGRTKGSWPACCSVCRCDEGYEQPPLDLRWHEVPADHASAGADRDGQQRMFRNAAAGVVEAAREKRETLSARVERLMAIRSEDWSAHRVIWHDLEAERLAIEAACPAAVSVYGSQDLDAREAAIIAFSEGQIQELAAKPVMLGSGCNLQHHCAWAVFLGIGHKFKDFIQAVHRLRRFGQTKTVRVDLIYSEAEREIRRSLEAKWRRHDEQSQRMAEIIREYGLARNALDEALQRSIVETREEAAGEAWRLVNADAVEETRRMAEASVDLIVTSIPFANQYEYTPAYNDFGHTDDNTHFWRQMDFLTPELLRVLAPGRIAAIHVKDRITPGGINGFGFQTVTRFSDQCADHFEKHGFAFIARKIITTDVVRENNQTYRLGWTEQCKDGSRQGAGMPEYLLIFRKAPSDRSNGYADVPVVKAKPLCDDHGEPAPFDPKTNWRKPVPGTGYSRAIWQFDAHGYERSSGNRLLSSAELLNLPHDQLYKLWRNRSTHRVYDFAGHVAVAEELDHLERLPSTFMLLPPHSWHPDVWSDVARMRTLNSAQATKGRELHLCPLQLDIVDRAIVQYSMAGETVFDPFCGIGTVPYCAIKLKRRAVGTELNTGYFRDGVGYCQAAEREISTPTLFDLLEAGAQPDSEAAA